MTVGFGRRPTGGVLKVAYATCSPTSQALKSSSLPALEPQAYSKWRTPLGSFLLRVSLKFVGTAHGGAAGAPPPPPEGVQPPHSRITLEWSVELSVPAGRSRSARCSSPIWSEGWPASKRSISL